MYRRSESQFEFKSIDNQWFSLIAGGLAMASLVFAFAAAFTYYFGDNRGPGISIGLAAFIFSIYIGYTSFDSWSLEGRVVIGDGFVRVYERRKSKSHILKFEAPYSAFRQLQVKYHKGIKMHEGSEPLVTVDLLHDIANKPKISLFEYKDENLDEEHWNVVTGVASMMSIPIVEC